MADNIKKLPLELISNIISFVEDHSTLVAVAQASSECYDLVKPHLYGQISIRRLRFREFPMPTDANYFIPDGVSGGRRRTFRGAIVRFLRRPFQLLRKVKRVATRRLRPSKAYILDSPTQSSVSMTLRSLVLLFSRKPELAAYLTHLTVRDLDSEFFDRQSFSGMPCKKADRKDLQSLAVRFLPPADDKALKELNDMKAELSLLLLLLYTAPNIKTLDLEILESSQDLLSHFKLITPDKTTTKPLMLNSLATVMISGNCYSDTINLAPMTFPNIKSIYLHGLSSSWADDDDDNTDPTTTTTTNHDLILFPPKSSSATYLELRNCELLDTDLRSLLSAPTNLKTFVYEYVPAQTLSHAPANFHNMRKAMEQQTETLEEISLEYSCRIYQSLIDEDVFGPTDTSMFADFKSLKRLRVATVVLFNRQRWSSDLEHDPLDLVKALPPGIEWLALTRASDHAEVLCDAIRALLERTDEKFTRLKEVEVELSVRDFLILRRSFVDLKRMATLRGVKLNLFNDNSVSTRSYQPDLEHGPVWYTHERMWGMDRDVRWRTCMSSWNSGEGRTEILFD